MKWITALILGAILGFVTPLVFGGREGVWAESFASAGTVAPFSNSPGLLFSIPVFALSAIAFRMFFNWHDR